jgi:hypothetical protein
VKESCIQDTT